MSKKGFSFRFCSFAGGFSLLLFSGVSMAAGVDTGKIQPKVANVPVPAPAPPVKAAPPTEINGRMVVTMTITATPPPQAPKAVVNTPTYNVRPKTQVKLPPQTVRPNTNVKHAPQTYQPRVNVPTPTQKVPTLDPRYAPKLPPALSAPLPGKDLRTPAVATPTSPATNALGGSKIDRQTLDRIQNIQEAATAAQVFKQLEELKNAKDLNQIGAAQKGLPGEGTGAIRDAGGHLGIAGQADASTPGTPRPDPSNPGSFLSTGSADPAEGSRSAAPDGGLDTSRTGWVSSDTTTTTTNTVGGHTGSTSITQDEDGNVVGYSTETSSRNSGGGTDTTKTKQVPGSGEVTVTETATDSGGDVVYSSSTTFRALKGGGYKYNTIHTDSSVTGETSTGTVGSLPPGTVIINPNENYDNKQYNDCVQGAGGCAKKTRTKPMDTITQPSKGDADTDPGPSSIIGAAAVTNEDEFHSGGGGGGGGGVNKDMLTQPPIEGAEGGGGTPPAPSGASLEEALGDAALH